MNLNEYKTPLTDANAGFAVTNKGLNYTQELYVERDNIGPFVHASFARDLERKLAMCRDALREISNTAYNAVEISQNALKAIGEKL